MPMFPLITSLPDMTLVRMKLSPQDPVDSIFLAGDEEVLVYPLLGHAMTSCGRVSRGRLGCNRADVRRPVDKVLRWVPNGEAKITFTLADSIADFLIVVAKRKEPVPALMEPLIQTWDIWTHTVGQNTTHERTVTEVVPVIGSVIQAGETLNCPGGWSSFPAHADPEKAKKLCHEHCEVFFVVTPGVGYMFFDGYFIDGSEASGIVKVENGDALVTPLGSHPIVFTPGHWGWYFWAYVSTAITKTYNRYADECGLKEYVE